MALATISENREVFSNLQDLEKSRGRDFFFRLQSFPERIELRFGSGRKLFPGGTIPNYCLLYTSPSPRDGLLSRMPSSA